MSLKYEPASEPRSGQYLEGDQKAKEGAGDGVRQPRHPRQLLYQEIFQKDGPCSKHRSLLHELTD